MEKSIRKAVRCYLLKDTKVLAIKYKEGAKRAGYYDIPGGKIEKGENAEQASRETNEETGILVKELIYKGNMIIEYFDRIYDFDVFVARQYEGNLQENLEDVAEFIEIAELIKKEKVLATVTVLDRFFINGLVDNKYNFKMQIKVDDNENILDLKYSLEEK